jgi:hypothetical protein
LVKTHGSIAIFVLLTIALSRATRAQLQNLSPPARRLTNALADLRNNPNDSDVEERYLNAFPRSYADFLSLFDYRRELADGHDYIDVLPSLAKLHDEEVGALLWDSARALARTLTPPSSLQAGTATYGSQHTATFAILLEKLSPADRAHVISFLADVENFRGYPEYQTIIDNLKKSRQHALANEFEAARTKRQSAPNN